MERWKDVDGFGGLYSISSNGRVRNKRSGALLKPSCSGNYKHIQLCFDGKRKDVLVHRLVAKAFVENPYQLNVVNHIDEDKHNNNAENLEWCTTQYNSTYGVGALSRNTKVNQYSFDGVFLRQWDSIKEAAEYYSIKYQGISRCCRGLRKHCYGYGWKYAGKEKS